VQSFREGELGEQTGVRIVDQRFAACRDDITVGVVSASIFRPLAQPHARSGSKPNQLRRSRFGEMQRSDSTSATVHSLSMSSASFPPSRCRPYQRPHDLASYGSPEPRSRRSCRRLHCGNYSQSCFSGWQQTHWFRCCALFHSKTNGCMVQPNPHDAVNTMLAVADGKLSEAELAQWFRSYMRALF
jgi:hypothetical protein